MHEILEGELTEEAEKLQLLIRKTTEEIHLLQQRINALGKVSELPKDFLRRYAELNQRINALQ